MKAGCCAECPRLAGQRAAGAVGTLRLDAERLRLIGLRESDQLLGDALGGRHLGEPPAMGGAAMQMCYPLRPRIFHRTAPHSTPSVNAWGEETCGSPRPAGT